jgi:hypothetical protein
MICRSDGAYRNLFCGNYKDLAPTEHALALEMSSPALPNPVPYRCNIVSNLARVVRAR